MEAPGGQERRWASRVACIAVTRLGTALEGLLRTKEILVDRSETVWKALRFFPRVTQLRSCQASADPSCLA
jgi:hypothetical protein